MTKATNSIKTEYRDGILFPVPLAASAVVLMGTFAVIGADGYALSSQDVGTTADQTCLGIWENDAENADIAGAVQGVVRRNKHFLVSNSSADPVTQADLGALIYIEDNQTVAKTDGSGTRSVAGLFMGFDTEYTTHVWVEIA